MPERVKEMKCGGGGGGFARQFEGRGYAGEGTEDKMQGRVLRKKKLRGVYAGEG